MEGYDDYSVFGYNYDVMVDIITMTKALMNKVLSGLQVLKNHFLFFKRINENWRKAGKSHWDHDLAILNDHVNELEMTMLL